MALNFSTTPQSKFTQGFNQQLNGAAPKKPTAQPLQQPVQQQPPKAPPQTLTMDEARQQVTGGPKPSGFQDLMSPSKKPFNLQDTKLFQETAKATGKQLSGEIPGINEQETIARETQRVAQSKRDKDIREQLTQQGFRDTGKFIEEGIIKSESQQQREREELDRQLIADRAGITQQTIGQGAQNAQGLLGLVQGGEQANQQVELKQQEMAQNLELANIDVEGKKSLTELQGRINQGLAVTQGDINSSKDALDRAHQLAVQNKDINAQNAIEQMQADLRIREIDQKLDLAKIDVAGKQTITELQGKIAAGAQITENEFIEVQNALNRAQQLAQQKNDMESLRFVENLRAQLAREGILSGEKIAFAQIASEEGLAALDQDGKIALTELQGKINEGLAVTQGDIKGAESALNRAHALAVQSNDQTALLEIEKMRQDLALKGFASNEKIAMARITSDENLANLSIEAQENIVKLKDELDTNKLMTVQDFEATQNELANDHDLAVQSKNIEAQAAIEQMQADLQLVMQEKQQEFSSAERVATQGWQSDERLGQQDFVTAEAYLDRLNEMALQSKNIQAEKDIVDQKGLLQLKLQTNDMTHDEAMVNLSAQLQEAKDNKDFLKEKHLLVFSHNKEMEKIQKEQGHEKSMQWIQGQISESLQKGEFQNTKVLTEMQHEQQMKIHQDNLLLDQGTLDLQQAGFDMAALQQTYKNMQEQVALGALDPAAALEFFKSAAEGQIPDDFEFTEPNPNAVQDALAADFVNQQFQWALQQGDANGDGLLDAGIYEGNTFVGLSDTSLEPFLTHMNETIYNLEGGNPVSNDLIGIMSGEKDFGTITGVDDPVYQAMLNHTSIPKTSTAGKWGFTERFNGDGGKTRSIYNDFENSEFVRVGNTILHVDSISRDQKAGDDDTIYGVTNILTGQTLNFKATDRDKSSNEFNINDKLKGIGVTF